MGLDINKLIMESIAEVENTTQDVVVENNMHESPYSLLESVAPAVPSAIAAGLGALTIVNRMRNIQESGDEEGWMDKLGKMFTPKEVGGGKEDAPDMIARQLKTRQEQAPDMIARQMAASDKKDFFSKIKGAASDFTKWASENPGKTVGGLVAGGAAGGAAGVGAMALAKRKQAAKK